MSLELRVLLIACTSFILLAGCSVRNIRALDDGMKPTIPNGSIVTVDREAFRNVPIKRYDIVAVSGKGLAPERFLRVIGLPGESILLRRQGARINGYYLDDLPYGLTLAFTNPASNEFASVSEYPIPSDAYFLIGDNVADAKDSRHEGAIASRRLNGKAIEISRQ